MDVIHNIDEKRRKTGCPFGHCCDECNLYRPLYKQNQDGSVTQIFDCQWNNIALMQAESKDRILGVQQAVESRGNEQIKRADAFLNLALESKENAALPRQ